MDHQKKKKKKKKTERKIKEAQADQFTTLVCEGKGVHVDTWYDQMQ